MGIEIRQDQLVKPEEKRKGIVLGNLEKVNPLWVAGLGWDDLPNGDDVDGDLWVVGANYVPADVARGVAEVKEGLDLAFYDPNDRTKIVDSMMGTGAFQYQGDARSGKGIKGDDEQTFMDLSACRTAGMNKILVIGNIYEPDGLDWSKIPNAYLRIYPKGVSDRQGNILKPDKADAIKVVRLTEIGAGARCIVFGEFDWQGGADTNWKLNPNPSLMTSLREGLASFDIRLPEDYPA
jgi:hypothetical protein